MRIGFGNRTKQVRPLPPFTEFELLGSAKVEVRVGGEQLVEIEIDTNLLNLIVTEVQAERLLVSRKQKYFSIGGLVVTIVVPSLRIAVLSGSGLVRISNVSADQFALSLDGSGSVAASGTAQRLKGSISGAGDFTLFDLICQDADVAIDGKGTIQLTVRSSLRASISGVGKVRYRGDPKKVDTEISGSGSIEKG